MTTDKKLAILGMQCIDLALSIAHMPRGWSLRHISEEEEGKTGLREWVVEHHDEKGSLVTYSADKLETAVEIMGKVAK